MTSRRFWRDATFLAQLMHNFIYKRVFKCKTILSSQNLSSLKCVKIIINKILLYRDRLLQNYISRIQS